MSAAVKEISWADAAINIIGRTPPEDTLELRNSFIEGCMLDEFGEHVVQDELHLQMQRVIYEWRRMGFTKGIITAPPDSGKSQQLPIGLATYLQTIKPEIQQLIISADDEQVKKRVRANRMMTESREYRYWCAEHHIEPLVYSSNDSRSSNRIYFESRNRTGNPSMEAYSVLSNTLGQRAHILWLDDVCTNKDKNSTAHREQVYDQVSNVWAKRVRKPRTIWGVRTKWHPQDANSMLIASGRYCHLEIVVKESKDGYHVREFIPEALEGVNE